MIEVFVAFTKTTDLKELEKTLEAWNLSGMEPVAIQVKANKFELHRRVTAENLATGNYVLADLGYGPLEEDFVKLAEVELRNYPDVGLIGVSLDAMICRKGIVTHWPTPRTQTYRKEHVEAYQHAGFEYLASDKLHCYSLVTAARAN